MTLMVERGAQYRAKFPTMAQSPDLPTYLIRFGPFVSMASQNHRPNFGTTTCNSYCTGTKFLSFQPPVSSSSRRRSRAAVASKARADAAAARTRADVGGAAEGGRSDIGMDRYHVLVGLHAHTWHTFEGKIARSFI